MWRSRRNRPSGSGVDPVKLGTGVTRLLQARRAALRVLDRLTSVAVEALSPSARENYERVRAAAETTSAITDPDWVETAQREQLLQGANHLIDPASAN